MKKKNLLLLINQLYGGGAQKVIAALSTYLAPYYHVTLVVYNDTDKIVFPYSGDLVRISLPYPEDTHNNSFYKRIIRFFSLARQVRKIKKERKIDVCISFLEASNIINILSQRKEKLVISVRSFLSHEFDDHPRLKIFRHFIRILYKRAHHIIVPSLLIKDDLVKRFGVLDKRISLIYNFTDPELIAQLKKEQVPGHLAELFSKNRIIINVGRITNPKAQWLLVPVLSKVKKVIPEAKLVILGEGPLEEKIRSSASTENLRVYREGKSNTAELADNYDIYLLGFIKNPFPYLEAGELFIKSSVYEGFPNVIIEAMGSGLPIISSDCASGPREIISPSSDFLSKAVDIEYDEYGVLTPVWEKSITEEQYASFASAAIIDLMTDANKKNHYRNQSLKRAKDFEKEKILQQWIDLIESK